MRGQYTISTTYKRLQRISTDYQVEKHVIRWTYLGVCVVRISWSCKYYKFHGKITGKINGLFYICLDSSHNSNGILYLFRIFSSGLILYSSTVILSMDFMCKNMNYNKLYLDKTIWIKSISFNHLFGFFSSLNNAKILQ